MPLISSALTRSLLRGSAVILSSLAGALLLRWALDPILQNDLPLVTLFGAVAITVWVARWRFAVITALLGYAIATYLFVAPRDQVSFGLRSLVGLVLYGVSCAIIIYFGERMHRANAHALAVSVSRDQVEDALTSEKELLAITLASIGDAVIVTDSEGHVVSLNTEAERLTGWTTSETIGTPLSRVFHIVNEQSKAPVESPVDKALREGVAVALANHTVLISKDGREIPIDDSAAPIKRGDGPVLGVALIFRDVTEQRRAQAARARLAAIVEFSGDAIITKNLKGIIQTWNRGAEKLFGFSAYEIVGKSATTLFPSDRLQEEDAILEKLRRGQSSERLETIRITKDGHRIPVLVSVSPLKDVDGEVIGASTIIHDVSDIVAARGELTREKELLTTTLASIGDAVIVTDEQSRVTFLNSEAERLTGWTNADAAGRPLSVVFRIVNEHTRRVAENPVEKALRLGAVVGLANHTMLLRSDGAEFLIDDSAAPIRVEDEGPVSGVVLVFRDVTEQRRAYEAREQLAAIVEYSGEAIVTKNLDGIIQTWNKSAEKLFGYSADEIVGHPVTVLIPPERQWEEEQILSRLRRDLPAERLETVRLTKDGFQIPVSLTVSPLKNAEGEIVGASKLIQDISERKRIDNERQELLTRESALRNQAEQAARVKDEFLATVSHELRTPLNAMLGWATLLNQGNMDQPTAARGMEAIERNARAQAQLIEDLLDVSRMISGKLRLEIEPINLIPIVDAAVDAVKPAADAKEILLDISIDSDANSLRGDPARLQQVIWNLLSNSIKFTPPGGKVETHIRRAASMIEILVRDTGIGINPEFLPFVFDRFQQADASTTRKHGGLGLGLAITRSLVEMHGGTIEAESQGDGQGATFRVRLPIPALTTEALNDEPGFKATSVDSANLNGIRVLAVDDSPDTRELVFAVLGACGATVITAASVREAFDLFTAWKPDVLVCDIGMPEENGYTFIRRIRELSADAGGNTPAIALTGYVRVQDRMKALEAGYEMFVPKPIEASELCTIVASVAGGSGKPQ
jgi:PAS domain S-box-containing protein